MSDLSPVELRAIQAKLSRLGSGDDVFEGRWLNIGSATGAPMLTRMLQEIDDTVLPLSLTFQRGDAEIKIDVAGRRLVRVQSIGGLDSSSDELHEKTISPEDDEAMKGLTAHFQAFADMSGGASVQAEKLRDAPDGANVGVSLYQLEEAWGLKVELPEGDTPLQMLRSGLGDMVKAYMIISEGLVERFKGKKAFIKEIEDLVENRLMGFDEQRLALGYNHADPSLTVLNEAGPDGETILVAVHGSEILIAIGEKALAPDAHRLWRLIA